MVVFILLFLCVLFMSRLRATDATDVYIFAATIVQTCRKIDFAL